MKSGRRSIELRGEKIAARASSQARNPAGGEG
jgi:hypothetical protein